MLRLTYASIIIITVELVSKLQGRCQVEKACFCELKIQFFLLRFGLAVVSMKALDRSLHVGKVPVRERLKFEMTSCAVVLFLLKALVEV